MAISLGRVTRKSIQTTCHNPTKNFIILLFECMKLAQHYARYPHCYLTLSNSPKCWFICWKTPFHWENENCDIVASAHVLEKKVAKNVVLQYKTLQVIFYRNNDKFGPFAADLVNALIYRFNSQWVNANTIGPNRQSSCFICTAGQSHLWPIHNNKLTT